MSDDKFSSFITSCRRLFLRLTTLTEFHFRLSKQKFHFLKIVYRNICTTFSKKTVCWLSISNIYENMCVPKVYFPTHPTINNLKKSYSASVVYVFCVRYVFEYIYPPLCTIVSFLICHKSRYFIFQMDLQT